MMLSLSATADRYLLRALAAIWSISVVLPSLSRRVFILLIFIITVRRMGAVFVTPTVLKFNFGMTTALSRVMKSGDS